MPRICRASCLGLAWPLLEPYSSAKGLFRIALSLDLEPASLVAVGQEPRGGGEAMYDDDMFCRMAVGTLEGAQLAEGDGIRVTGEVVVKGYTSQVPNESHISPSEGWKLDGASCVAGQRPPMVLNEATLQLHGSHAANHANDHAGCRRSKRGPKKGPLGICKDCDWSGALCPRI